jgi:outer membrane protein
MKQSAPGKLATLFVAGLLTATPGLLPGVAHGQSLTDALEASYDFNPELKAQRAGVRAIDEDVFTALGGWMPTVSLTASVTGSMESTTPEGSGTSQGGTAQSSGSLDVSYTLYNGGLRDAELGQAREASGGARADLMATEQRILATAGAAYIDVLTSRQVLAALQNNVFTLQDFLEGLERLVENGQRTAFDLADSRIQIGEALTSVAAQEQVVGQAEARYRALIGVSPGALEDFPTLPELPSTAEGAVQEALANNPSTVSAQAAVKGGRQAVKAAEADRLPTVSVTGTLAREDVYTAPDSSSIGTPGESTYGSVKLSVTVPIFQGGVEYSAIRKAKQTENRQRLSLVAVQERIRQEVMTAWSALDSSRSQLVAARARLEAATFSYNALQRRLDQGQISLLDTLNIRQRYVQAQTALIGAQGDLWSAQIDLLRALGRFGARDLNLDVDYYDPDTYFQRTKANWTGTDVQ